MTDIWFYHLQRLDLNRALPLLLEKTVARQKRAVVMAGSPERVEFLNQHLWQYRDESWLPHGSEKDGHAEHQPIWLTAQDENPNAADFLFLTDRAMSDQVSGYERVILLFDDRDREAVAEARERWKAYRDEGHTLSYWQQTNAGGWEKKAEHTPSPA
jgi:DNA polymerase-3 subunit chi